MIDYAIIQSLGFPIAMCIWFMWRLEPLIHTNNKVLALVTDELRKKKRI